MNNLVSRLRQTYPVFEYLSSSWELKAHTLHASWQMKAGNIKYRPQLTIPIPNLVNQDPRVLDKLIFQLGLAEIPSYWKATCSPIISIKAGNLSPSQLDWWHDLYLKGMGEYYYLNQIDFSVDNFLYLESQPSNKTKPNLTKPTFANNPLILSSGGKDTAVTLSLLTQTFSHVDTLTILRNQTKQPILLESFSLNHKHIGKRTIDPTLLSLDTHEFLNGHIPFSAYLAFAGLVTAYLSGSKDVIVSNEASANECNLKYLGHEINHQYSKSLEFEQKFQSYLYKNLNLGITYFSFLRPLYELQITGILARYPSLLPVFMSCNRAAIVGQTSWCTKCAKCLSTYLMLASFIKRDQLVTIFGHDLLDDPDLIPLYRKLLGLTKHKPFECVSTYQEISVASSFSLRQYPKVLPKLLQFYSQQSFVSDPFPVISYFGPHSMPKKYSTILQKALPIKVE